MHSASSDTSSLGNTKPAPSARYKDGSSGGAASVNKTEKIGGMRTNKNGYRANEVSDIFT